MTTPAPPPASPAGPPSAAPSQPAATATTTGTASPATPAPDDDDKQQGSDDFAGLPVALLAAALTALVAVWLARRKARAEARDRARLLYAEAYQWYAAYKEFPYAIRRRRPAPPPEAPAEERIRLSEALREVQTKISYFEAWTKIEDPKVGTAYATLTENLRTIAGKSMEDAWKQPGTGWDKDMNIGKDRVDLDALEAYEKAYLKAVRKALTPRWRRKWA